MTLETAVPLTVEISCGQRPDRIKLTYLVAKDEADMALDAISDAYAVYRKTYATISDKKLSTLMAAASALQRAIEEELGKRDIAYHKCDTPRGIDLKV